MTSIFQIAIAALIYLQLTSESRIITNRAIVKSMPFVRYSCSNGYQIQIANTRLISSSVNVSHPAECATTCLLIRGNEVVQYTVTFNDTGHPQQRECIYTKIKARYLNSFPRRYFQCIQMVKMISKVFYRSEQVGSAMYPSLTMPLFFFALDDVSGSMNLVDSISSNNYVVQWVKGYETFNCSWKSDYENRAKSLRMIPNMNPWLRVVHNVSYNVTDGFSWLLWFKKANGSSTNTIFYDGMLNGNATRTWTCRDSVDNKIACAISNAQQLTANETYSLLDWNHIAMTVIGNNYQLYLNGTLTGNSSGVPTTLLGDSINIGRRTWKSPYVNVLEGCLSHFILFKSSLSEDDIKQWMNLMNDDSF